MKIAILNTGNELLRGTTVNTNLSFIGRELAALGEEPDCSITVPDNPGDMRAALESLFSTHDLVIVTGGLGPTSDDLTREVVCELLGEPLREDHSLRQMLEEYWNERHPDSAGPDFYFRQALVPVNGAVLKNRNGTAPGLWIPGLYHGRSVFAALLPGPPTELEPMVHDELLPLLLAIHGESICTDKFMLADTPELAAQEFVEAALPAPLKVSYSASPEGTRVFISGTDPDKVYAATKQIKVHFGRAVVGAPHLGLAEELLDLLTAARCKLATAESCTGGLIGASFTDQAGASAVYEGGVISYSNEVKVRELGVSGKLLEQHGAVSPECARAMVEGACRRFNTEAGIAATGIAGPSGGTPDKPVGLVYIAATLNGRTEVRQLRLRGSREQIRRRTVAKAMNLLRELLIG
jgi:nicotinamide-nucleotide amidase